MRKSLFLILFLNFIFKIYCYFLCDLISSSNISNIHLFIGWECSSTLQEISSPSSLSSSLSSSSLKPIIPFCQWSHISCFLNEIISIDLSKQEISGTIPSSISELTSLKYLVLDQNYFQGTLPSSINKLEKLKSLQIVGNSFTGTIPNLNSLNSLTSLYLSHNLFTGTLPSSILNLKKLSFISLNDNKLNGPIPHDYISSYKNLLVLDIANNQLTGIIPSTFCSTSTTLYTYGNPNLINTCEETCLEKGCNRKPILNNFNQGLSPKAMKLPEL